MEPEWTQEQAVAYECAVECISDMVSIRTEKIWDEKHAANPNRALIGQRKAKVQQLSRERSALSVHSHEGIARFLRDYGAEVRSDHLTPATAL